jgi:hypothetical protein
MPPLSGRSPRRSRSDNPFSPVHGIGHCRCDGALRSGEAECGKYPSDAVSLANRGRSCNRMGNTQALGEGRGRGTPMAMRTALPHLVLIPPSGRASGHDSIHVLARSNFRSWA